ncbi:MAG: DUF1207 domain-containing protein [Thermoguttaceae bacterium]
MGNSQFARSAGYAFILLAAAAMGPWSARVVAQPEAMPPTLLGGAAPSDADVVPIRPPSPLALLDPQPTIPPAEPDAGDYGEPWTWQLLPDGLLYPAYLAGNRESRFGTEFVNDKNLPPLWDIALGGHVGLIRYGAPDAIDPEGWQVDMEGAAFPRLTLDDHNLVATDYRFGVLLTTRQGPWEWKFGGYHLSSHFGDQYLYEYPDVDRIHYSRTGLVTGVAYRPTPDWRFYAETGWAWSTGGGAEPWEFQFGAEYSPARPTGWEGAPFMAVNGHLRQENNYGGNLTVEAGWQWRGRTGHLFRTGLYYFNGMSDETEFFNKSEQLLGGGVWFDY